MVLLSDVILAPRSAAWHWSTAKMAARTRTRKEVFMMVVFERKERIGKRWKCTRMSAVVVVVEANKEESCVMNADRFSKKSFEILTIRRRTLPQSFWLETLSWARIDVPTCNNSTLLH